MARRTCDAARDHDLDGEPGLALDVVDDRRVAGIGHGHDQRRRLLVDADAAAADGAAPISADAREHARAPDV